LLPPSLAPSLSCSLPLLLPPSLAPSLSCSLPLLLPPSLAPSLSCSLPLLLPPSLAPSLSCSLPLLLPPSLAPYLTELFFKQLQHMLPRILSRSRMIAVSMIAKEAVGGTFVPENFVGYVVLSEGGFYLVNFVGVD